MKVFWTDGSAEPNPGLGGWAVIEQADNGGAEGVPVALGGEPETTNIRMEGSALKAAMELAGGEHCEIHTDSEFWVNVLTKWAPNWKANEWKKKTGPIKNLELVQELYGLYSVGNVNLVWVRGHVGTELNEMADEWANKARLGERL